LKRGREIYGLKILRKIEFNMRNEVLKGERLEEEVEVYEVYLRFLQRYFWVYFLESLLTVEKIWRFFQKAAPMIREHR
jgi:hypothetical protein